MVDEKFAALSLPEKRVAIARDVIAQLDLKKIVATSGTYLTVDPEGLGQVTLDTDMQEVLSRAKACDACALGSMFICTVAKMDACDTKAVEFDSRYGGDFVMRGAPYDYLSQFFGRDELNRIEAAFEGWGNWSECDDDDNCDHVISDNEDTRLRVIMKDIIDHNGDFTLTPGQFQQEERGAKKS